jgi:hypothetical protein
VKINVAVPLSPLRERVKRTSGITSSSIPLQNWIFAMMCVFKVL